MRVNFMKKYKFLVISISWKKIRLCTVGKKLNIRNKNVNIEVENFKHLCSNTYQSYFKIKVQPWRDGWMDGRRDGSKSQFKGCLQQSKIAFSVSKYVQ